MQKLPSPARPVMRDEENEDERQRGETAGKNTYPLLSEIRVAKPLASP